MQDATVDTDAGEALSPRRVLIVTDSVANGGMERQLVLLAQSLPKEWAVRVVALADGLYAGVLSEGGVETTILPRRSRFDITPAFPLTGIIRSWRPAVVNTWGWMSTAASILPCRVTGIPVVDSSIRTGAVLTRGDRLVRAMASRADIVIANSQAGLDAYGVDPSRGRVVYNGFDPDRWELCQGGRQAEEPTTVVMTARMHRHKDYRCLLDAARILSSQDPSAWRFLAVGSGDERPALLSDYRDLIESGVAEFPEAGNEVLGLVREAHIGVLLTDPAFAVEGLSNSIMEYMACGLPVVCTASGGNLEVVLEGETGLFVPPGDAGAVAKHLQFLRDSPEAARRMGQAGRERIATEFTVEALVKGTVATYDSAMDLRERRTRPRAN
jgi:glycosyltransferase involved in cell wall biosynthesis